VSKSIVIFTEGTLGDHLPFIALGTALIRRGHRVTMVMNRAMLGFASETGIHPVVLPDETLGPDEARESAAAWNHWISPAAMRYRLRGSPHERVPYVEKTRLLVEVCGSADLFVSTAIRDLPWVVAHISRIPWITVSLNPGLYARQSRTLSQRQDTTLRRETARSRELARYVLESLGCRVPALPDSWYGFRSPITLLAASPHFSRPCRKGMAPGARLVATGFWFYEDSAWSRWRPDERLRRVCEGDPKPLVLSMSSQPVEDARRVLRAHVDAASLVDRPLVVQRGWAGFSEGDIDRAANRDMVVFADFLPQQWLFARAACAMIHGGQGSTARALAEGCPVLVEPFGNDQFFSALRVLRLRVGAAVHPINSTAHSIAGVLQSKVLGAGVRRRSQELGARLRGEDGIGQACRAIEAVLAGQLDDRDRVAPFTGRRSQTGGGQHEGQGQEGVA
jgi:UDP:flavonoid glycosyltransferase YjiC (YdhE family)